MTTVPFVITKKDGQERHYDIFSLLLSDRIIFVNGMIDDSLANSVVAQLLYLDAENQEKEISLYINSPGGSVSAGLAIYDTIRFVKAPVHTIGLGLAASMGSLLLSSGNRRSVLPHTKVMMHQPILSGGLGGNETNIKILAEDLTNTRRTLTQIYAKNCNLPEEEIERDIENDRYMDAEEAVKYGICDTVIQIA